VYILTHSINNLYYKYNIILVNDTDLLYQFFALFLLALGLVDFCMFLVYALFCFFGFGGGTGYYLPSIGHENKGLLS
jgi:uncharacterized membrane protein